MPPKSLKQAEEIYHQTRGGCEALLKNAETTLGDIKETLGSYQDSPDWEDLIEHQATTKLEKIQAVLGSMIHHHLSEIKEIIKPLDKSMQYVPNLREIAKTQTKKERENLLKAIKNPENQTTENIEKIYQKIELLHSELLENEPQWIENLSRYIAHHPLLQHYTECGKLSLQTPTKQTSQLAKKISGFQHPYLPTT